MREGRFIIWETAFFVCMRQSGVENFITHALVFLLIFWGAAMYASDGNNYSVQLLYSFPEGAVKGTKLSAPQALAANNEGHLFVVDTGNNRIVKFDQTGKVVLTVGGFGWEIEQFDRPLDVTAKTGLDVFIADYNNERIERYDKDLHFLSSFSSTPSLTENLQFGFPTGVDISKHGELFICDNENNRILKVDTFGEPVLSFGDFSWGEGQLQAPVKIEISRDDKVYVSDKEAARIVVFDYYGNFLARFGGKFLQEPNGLAWSRSNQLFVADTGNKRIVVFDKEHRHIFAWGTAGDKLGAFHTPVDVETIDEKIFVLDAGSGLIQAFKLIQAKL